MRRWNPQSTPGRWFALILIVGLTAAMFYPVQHIIAAFTGSADQWRINLELYGWILLLLVLFLLTGILIYRAIAAFTLAYELDRNGLYIVWLGNRAIVPLDQIISVDIGATGLRMPWRPLQGIGYYWGQGRTEDDKLAHLFSTRSPQASLIINTENASYVVSPDDRDSFIQELEQRRNLGSTKAMDPMVEPGRIFVYAFWEDRIVRRLLVCAFLLNLINLGLLMWRYPSLPGMLEMRFDALGQVSEFRPQFQILFIPLAALAVTLVNIILGVALYLREQLSAQLLQGASVIAQILFLVALITIIS